MATLITDPVAPVVGDTVTVGLSGALGAQLDVIVTSVPDGSQVPLGRLAAPFVLVPDRPGDYGVTVADLVDYPSAPAYAGDPIAGLGRTEPAETILGTVFVGTRFDLPIRTADQHGATLRVAVGVTGVRSNSVLSAELVDPLDDLSRLSALDAGVAAALAALLAADGDTMGPYFPDAVASLVAAYEAHRVLQIGSFGLLVHVAPDATNAVRLDTPYSAAAAIASLNDLRDRVVRHMVFGLPAGGWHLADDTLNLPVAPAARTIADATVLYADLAVRVLPRHFQQSSIGAAPHAHVNPDSLTPLPAADPLSTVIAALLDAIASLNVSAPAGESQIVEDLSRMYGFKAE